MSSTRKTVKMARILHKLNTMLAISTCSPIERKAVTCVLTSILLDGGVYAGYGHLQRKELPTGFAPGLSWHDGQGSEISADEFYDLTPEYRNANKYEIRYQDDTRRFYYIHETLRDDYADIQREE